MSKASEFRELAKELRNAAAETGHKITRETILNLAEEFDRMAAHPMTNLPKKLPQLIR
jgi:hypothetical protein